MHYYKSIIFPYQKSSEFQVSVILGEGSTTWTILNVEIKLAQQSEFIVFM